MNGIPGVVSEQAMILIPALAVLGAIFKAIPAVPNWAIPLILLVPGVIGAMMLIGWNVPAAIQGVLVTGMAVYGNQLCKQIMKKKN